MVVPALWSLSRVGTGGVSAARDGIAPKIEKATLNAAKRSLLGFIIFLFAFSFDIIFSWGFSYKSRLVNTNAHLLIT